MDSFELNKVAAGILIALLVAMGGSLLSGYFVHSDKLAKPVLIVEGIKDTAPSGLGEAEEPLKPIAPLLAAASAERGQEIAKKCAQCHTFEKGAPHKIGPNLWNIIGSKLAHEADFAYSAGLKEKGGAWDYEKLNAFIHKPRAFINGTKMSFVGLQKPEERADVIAYLHTLSDAPLPLPLPSPPAPPPPTLKGKPAP